MRPNKPKPVDRSGYLANLIYEIVEGIRTPRHYHVKGETKWAVFPLAGGAEPDEWAGKCVVLYPCGTTVQGKPAVTVCARAPKPVAVVEAVPADVVPETETVPA